MFQKVSTRVDFAKQEEELLKMWEVERVFARSLEISRDREPFVFYEGPPTANGKPHVGHVISRAIKDLVPRYKTMCGYYVGRKGGWDTHGLPVELEVEKTLGLSGKQDIESYGVEAFIQKCKASVFRYVDEWRQMSERVGYWVDMDDPYVTYHNNYIESVWWILKETWTGGLLYKGHRVVPYCPRCGTALSSHEVAQGYNEVQDPSIYVRFPLIEEPGTALLVWTTTPWTLPSNVAAAIDPRQTYCVIQNGEERLILARARVEALFGAECEIINTFPGEQLLGTKYKAPYQLDLGGKVAHYVVTGDFVTMTDGTGMVHIAPAFGEDDMRVGVKYDLPVLQPVDVAGKFTDEVPQWQGVFVKDADPQIIRDLRERGILVKKEMYTHNYPFCWRCDTPLLYYARASWFIKMTAVRDRLVAINRTINWVPETIKEGRFGNWLENVLDWNISRERYWGTPLPIWVCECGHQHCIGSIAELRQLAVVDPGADIELHKPYVDAVEIRCTQCTGIMKRVPEVIDCWLDSGAMPYAQWHYPFENKDTFERQFPANFISEAIDQTRGWFYSLHALATVLFDRSAYENCLVLGHVMDQNGEKMSKHKGNVVDPWTVLNVQGADALRWYMYTVNPLWNSSRFYADAVGESQRKFIGTLWNTYAFFVLYANLDAVNPETQMIPVSERPEIDRWVMSRLNTVVRVVRERLDQYDIMPAALAIQEFVDELSNWYVRLNRRRFWITGGNANKTAAYNTLYECLVTLSKLLAPFTPFLADSLYRNLVCSLDPEAPTSVHLTSYPQVNALEIDSALEDRMALAQKLVSLGRAARNKVNIKNRQPLGQMIVFVRNTEERMGVEALTALIEDELNIKHIEFSSELGEYVNYSLKPRFNMLGKKLGKLIPKVQAWLAECNAPLVVAQMNQGPVIFIVDGVEVTLLPEEIEVRTAEKEGFAVETDGVYAVALDTRLSEDLLQEGLVRELINRIQTSRKEADFDVSDTIITRLSGDVQVIETALQQAELIKIETQSHELLAAEPEEGYTKEWDVNGYLVTVNVER